MRFTEVGRPRKNFPRETELEIFSEMARIWVERGATERNLLIAVIFSEGQKFSATFRRKIFELRVRRKFVVAVVFSLRVAAAENYTFTFLNKYAPKIIITSVMLPKTKPLISGLIWDVPNNPYLIPSTP